MTKLLAAYLILALSAGLCRAAQYSDLEDMIISTFNNSIVKIDVSNNHPIFNEKGENICRSLGTGFVISHNYVVTAEHVYKLDQRCSDPIIVLRTRTNVQRIALPRGAQNDVAVLEVETPFDVDTCALGLFDDDVYSSKGLRFGIPAELLDPEAVPVKIGEKKTQFAPMVVLTPTIVEKGESGGPVIYQFNVVGVTRARHQVYAGYSVMSSASNIRDLMKRLSIHPDGNICNPVQLRMFAGGASGWMAVTPAERLSAQAHQVVASELKDQAKVVTGAFYDAAHQAVVSRAPPIAASPPSNGFPNFIQPSPFPHLDSPFGGNKSLVPNAGQMLGGENPMIINPGSGTSSHPISKESVDAAVAYAVSAKARRSLWEKFVAEAEKSGAWNDRH